MSLELSVRDGEYGQRGLGRQMDKEMRDDRLGAEKRGR